MDKLAATANPEATILLGKYIGAGLATFGMLGAAIGVGLIFAAALQGIARNPGKEGAIKGFALLGMALAEFMGLLACRNSHSLRCKGITNPYAPVRPNLVCLTAVLALLRLCTAVFHPRSHGASAFA